MLLTKDSPRSRIEHRFDGPRIVDISVACSTGVAVVTVRGELDVSNSSWLHRCLHDAIDTGISEVVVDVEFLTFMDSSALRVIVGAHKQMRATGGRLTVLAPTPMVIRLFHIFEDVPHLMIQANRDAPKSTNSGERIQKECA
jgi:anti-anti-sigma factor